MKYVITFVLGATAGSLVAWKILEKKYKEIADEEIQSVKEYYKGKDDLNEFIKKADHVTYAAKDEFNSIEDKKVETTNYNRMVTDLGYADDDATIIVEQEEGVAPYVISPEEFGEKIGYDTESLTYYADGILANDDYEIMVDLDNLIGDGLEHFGEYEDDAVCVRNDMLKCDYEILKHDKTFEEVSARLG